MNAAHKLTKEELAALGPAGSSSSGDGTGNEGGGPKAEIPQGYVLVPHQGLVLAMRHLHEDGTVTVDLPGGTTKGMSYRSARHNCIVQTGLDVVLGDENPSYVDGSTVVYICPLKGGQNPLSVFARETNPRPLWVRFDQLSPVWRPAIQYFLEYLGATPEHEPEPEASRPPPAANGVFNISWEPV